MATSSFDSVFGVTTGQFVVPVGLTNALFINAASIPGCNSTQLKYNDGGTLLLVGCPAGATLTAVQLSTASGYLVGTSEVLSINGPVRAYLAATGATTRVSFIFGQVEGF